jgi:hypothetical protein
VQAFRNLIRQERQAQRHPSLFPPAKVINYALAEQTQHWLSSDALVRQKAEFFQPIEHAWDAIASEQYQTEEGEELPQKHFAGHFLSAKYQRAVALGEPRPEIIKLNPQQVKILDALAEAADIPHQRGQAEIEIPEHLRYYARHRFGPDGKLIF